MKSLQESFKEEVECFNTLTKLAEKHLRKKSYGNAAVYLEDASKSLKEMDKLQKEFADLSEGKVTITVQQLGGRLQ
ncbi:MAG TPA: hypothetical protein VK067_07495 [Pseudogracilibacillus sp.]|nr:hypothetical protein [Pseudogracilibacillus sp.]